MRDLRESKTLNSTRGVAYHKKKIKKLKKKKSCPCTLRNCTFSVLEKLINLSCTRLLYNALVENIYGLVNKGKTVRLH